MRQPLDEIVHIHTCIHISTNARIIDRSSPRKKLMGSIPSFSSQFPPFSLSSPSFPLSCWPSGSFLMEVNKSAMVSADTGGGGPLIGPVSIPADLMSDYLFVNFLFIYFFQNSVFLKMYVYIPGF